MENAEITIEGTRMLLRNVLPIKAEVEIITPQSGAKRFDWVPVHAELRELTESVLPRVGAVLFRGFAIDGLQAFQEFAAGFGDPLLGYDFASTPRSGLIPGVYTSTEYPAHQEIPLHNEQSYSRQWPRRIWFYCRTPASTGGETPIGDSREIFRRIAPGIRQRFTERGLLYVRNFGGDLDLTWQEAFSTQSRGAVEDYCRAQGIDYEWGGDGTLQTRQLCQAVAKHPVSEEWVWFNQAHLFHISALDPEVREALLDLVGEAALPRNVYYGNGSPIEDSILTEVRGVLDEVKSAFAWEKNDILMLDNMLVAHGRSRFAGPREVAVAMAGLHSEPNGSAHKGG